MNRRRWSGATTAPVVKRRPCRFGCGRSVDVFTENHRVIQLDTEPPAVTVDLTTVHLRIYEYRGPRIGWVPKFLPERGWRELRLLHECAAEQQKLR
ncbi:hypothetical protein SAMN05421837_107334 [Amycolatopsis pretoriensis]|uniref:Uncharacterized protein n=1 Tax=Amycolatopsis pretoriensis TaxID=218821 RepID=A0A1H5R7K2_9PSEU|nr:hypothetical protein [Amycolatopsis pretoriensis]SEF34353.1 hypothetical protein SAMN05421837_107334 [Amycolatopsis pretoriensis]